MEVEQRAKEKMNPVLWSLELMKPGEEFLRKQQQQQNYKYKLDINVNVYLGREGSLNKLYSF